MILVALKKAVQARFGITLFPGRHYHAKQISSDRWEVYPSVTEPVSVVVSDKNILHVLDID